MDAPPTSEAETQSTRRLVVVNTNTVTLAGVILALGKAAGRGQCPQRPCPLPDNASQRQNGPVPSGWGGTADRAVFRLGGQDRFGYWPPSRALRRPPWRSHQRHCICVHDHLASTKPEYDVIIVNLPDPQTAQINRFYTLEFFQEVASKLAPQGIFSFRLSAAENYAIE